MKVIALTGRAGSGKDTAASILQFILTDPEGISVELTPVDQVLEPFKTEMFDSYNNWAGYSILKFAWPVYEMAGIILGKHPNEIYLDRSFKTTVQYKGLTGRQLLQKLGTECFREVLGTDIWCDIMDRKLHQLKADGISGAIISALRFVNEAEFLKDTWNATITRVVGRDSGVPETHSSETELAGIKEDYTISNARSLVTLAERLTEFCLLNNLTTNKYTWK